jgi:signal transduction histidine kinase
MATTTSTAAVAADRLPIAGARRPRLRPGHLAAPPALLDAAVAVLALAGTLALIRHGGVTPNGPGSIHIDALAIGLAGGATLPLILWRRYPIGVFTATAAASVVLAALGYPVDLILGPTVALYLLAASRTPQSPWTRRTTASVVAWFVAYLTATGAADAAFPVIQLLHTGLAWAVAWFAGERTRLRRDQMDELNQRALRAERDAERERRLAVAEERARIARDLHDSAGHAISLIAVRAGAARLRHSKEPDRSLLALQAVEDLARHTAEEIDQIVATLRDAKPADGDIEAPPGMASVGTLIAHHEAAGLELTVATVGVPRPLASSADQAVYRILQQALSNAARYGSGHARVELAYTDAAVALTITNPVSCDAAPRPAGGHGLIGMRERAGLLGGILDIQRADGAFRIHAVIPDAGHRS